ncbi:MAG: BLUF domain-containing protein [Pseudomonadota bacterium]
MDDPQKLKRLVYQSQSLINPDTVTFQKELDGILAMSQVANEKVGLTGQLLCHRDIFVQILEGPEDSVDETFERICRDPRHTDVEVLDDGYQDHRMFKDWSMGCIGQGKISQSLLNELQIGSGLPQHLPSCEEIVIAIRIAHACDEVTLRLGTCRS